MNPTILLTICARAGSKGLRNKAMHLVAGKPLVRWTMEQARDYSDGRYVRVVVSSDHEEVLMMAASYGFTPIERPSDLCRDTVGKLDVIRHAYKFASETFMYHYPIVIDLDICNPLRTTQDIKDCVDLHSAEGLNVLYTVTPSRRNPYFNMVQLTEKEGRPYRCCALGTPPTSRQQAPQCYDINCCIYVYSGDWISNKNNIDIHQGKVGVLVMEEWQGFDIDTELDARIVELMLQRRMGIWQTAQNPISSTGFPPSPAGLCTVRSYCDSGNELKLGTALTSGVTVVSPSKTLYR